jgi:DNA-binding XRE family transcriptional regulator
MSKLKLLNKMHKINQEDLAKVLGTNRVKISRDETGKRKLDED